MGFGLLKEIFDCDKESSPRVPPERNPFVAILGVGFLNEISDLNMESFPTVPPVRNPSMESCAMRIP